MLPGLLGDRDPRAADLLSRLAPRRKPSRTIRAVMNDLRPTVLDDFGFIEALREYVAALQAQGGLDVTLKIDEAAKPTRPEVNVMLFACCRKPFSTFASTRRHAARRRMAGARGRRASLAIRDDGRGFDPHTLPRGHYGLLHMKERAEACGGS